MRLLCLYRRRERASVKERGNGLAKAHIQQYKNTYRRTHIHTHSVNAVYSATENLVLSYYVD